MQCPGCKVEVDPQVKFCPECGGAIGAASPGERLAGAGGTGEGAQKTAGETEIWQGCYSGKAMIGIWVLLGAISVLCIVGVLLLRPEAEPLGMSLLVWTLILLAIAWLYAAGVLLVRRMSVHFRATTQRLIHRRGILSATTDRIELIDVDDITVKQGVVERMLDVGTILVTSSDRSHPVLKLQGIDKVREVADILDVARRKERRSHGLHIESI